MTYPKIISHHFTIGHKGETRHLEIRLPRDAHRIVGVETSIRVLEPMDMLPAPTSFMQSFELVFAKQFGTLRLGQVGCIGQFYACTIQAEDRTLSYGDFSASASFAPTDFTHGFKRLEDPIETPKNTVVAGIYQDTSNLVPHLNYAVSIHLLYQKHTSC